MLKRVSEAGTEVLRRSLKQPGACAHLTAAWVGVVRDALNLPAYCIAGDLVVRGRMAFGGSSVDVKDWFTESTDAWDGHCWLAIGQHVGDLFLFRTAYDLPAHSNLRQTVAQ